MSDVGSEFEARADFVVSDLVVSRESDGATVSVSASIVNAGAREANVPDAWLKISTTSDFSSGYIPLADLALTPTADGDSILFPGEEQTFVVRTSLSRSVILPLGAYGTHYAQLWLNPDRSANLTNPEATVAPSHAAPESDYSNNLSPIVSFERNRPEGLIAETCTPDALEENDSLSAAAPIVTETSYTINPCDDWLDAFSLELQTGDVVEIAMVDNSTDWYRSVVSPNGTYLVRDERSGTSIVRAESSGIYHVAFRPVEFGVFGGRDNMFAVRKLR